MLKKVIIVKKQLIPHTSTSDAREVLNQKLLSLGGPAAADFLIQLVKDTKADKKLRLSAATTILEKVGVSAKYNADKDKAGGKGATGESLKERIAKALAELEKRGPVTVINHEKEEAALQVHDLY